MPGDVQVLGAALGRFLEGEGYLVAQVVALHRAPLPAAAAAAKPAAEKGGKYIVEAAKARAAAKPAEVGIAAAAEPGARLLVAELVVPGPLLGIGQYLVSLVDFLKFFLRRLVARIHVRVILFGQLAVGFFDVGIGGAFLHPQHLVVIALCRQTPHPSFLGDRQLPLSGSLSPTPHGRRTPTRPTARDIVNT